jgi:hypothetical protein
MSKFSVGDSVAFARDVVRRLGHDKYTADARGRVVAVDFGRTFVRPDDGATVRYVPAANLTKILANGVIL